MKAFYRKRIVIIAIALLGDFQRTINGVEIPEYVEEYNDIENIIVNTDHKVINVLFVEQ